MKRKRLKHSIDKVFVWILFVMFAILVGTVLLLGVNHYKSLVKRNKEAYNERIAMDYIAEKVRHNDVDNGILVSDSFGKKDEISTLHMYQKTEEDCYEIRIYYYNGYIRELFTLKGIEVQPEDGNPILKADSLKFSLNKHKLRMECIDEDGVSSVLSLYLRSGEENKT